jgi:hypothetical protein
LKSTPREFQAIADFGAKALATLPGAQDYWAMTCTPDLKRRRPAFRLSDVKPWQLALFVGVPAGNFFYFLYVFFAPSIAHFTIGSWLGMSLACFLIPFAGVTGAHALIDSTFSRIFGLRRRMDPREIERMELVGRIEKLDSAGDWRQANRLRVELLNKELANPAVVAFEIGRVFQEKLHSLVEALDWYRRCATYGEDNNAHFHEANCRAESLKDAVRADENDRRAREAAVAEAIAADDCDRAEAAIEELARLHPNSTAVHFFRGLVASRRGAHALAAGHYREALRADPDNEKAAYSLAVAQTKAGVLHPARQAWTEYLEKFPNADPQFIQNARDSLAEIDALLRPTRPCHCVPPAG